MPMSEQSRSIERIDPEPWRHFCPANLLPMNHGKSGYLECIEINIDVYSKYDIFLPLISHAPFTVNKPGQWSRFSSLSLEITHTIFKPATIRALSCCEPRFINRKIVSRDRSYEEVITKEVVTGNSMRPAKTSQISRPLSLSRYKLLGCRFVQPPTIRDWTNFAKFGSRGSENTIEFFSLSFFSFFFLFDVKAMNRWRGRWQRKVR